MKILTSSFGFTKDQKEVTKYTLVNNHGYKVGIINYGATITNIDVPDKDGHISNVVYGYENMEDHGDNPAYFGTVPGRFAGRIAKGTFTIDKEIYTLAQNDGTNCLHGGLKGFDKVLWSATTLEEKDRISVILNYLSPDMEEGFPGNYDITVKYTWNDDNSLSMEYIATTDKATVHAVTNHSYFNLSNDLSTSILDHELMIKAEKFVALDENSLPVDIIPTKDTPFNFTSPKKVGQDINTDYEQFKFTGGYDHPFIFDNNDGIVASLYCPETGRYMEVESNAEAVVLYSGNYLTPELKPAGTNGVQKNGALCLETQYIPNNINFDKAETHILKPGEVFKSKTSYTFTVK